MKMSTQALLQPDGTLRCPKDGSTQFETKRSTGRKIAFGFASLLGSTNEVRCLVCGTKYVRRAPHQHRPDATDAQARMIAYGVIALAVAMGIWLIFSH